MKQQEPLLVGAILVFVFTSVMAGGRAFVSPLSIVTLGLAAAFLVGTVVYTGAWRTFHRVPMLARVALGAIVALPAVQLVPLPPSVWTALPGRELVVAAFAQAGAADAWQPLTLAPAATIQTLIQAIWLIVLFVAAVPLSRAATDRMLDGILLLVVLHITLGVVQVASKGSVGNFLSSSDGRYLIGFFANKNHSALFLCFGAILALVRFSPERVLHRSNAAITFFAVAILAVATIATTSRAGIVLMALTLIGLALAFVDTRSLYRPRVLIGAAALLGVGVAIAASLRTTQTVFAHFGNASEDMRFLFWSWSSPMIEQFFPVGGGFGIFPDAFAHIEKLAWVKPTYVNHVHNEYIEMIIEAGVFPLVILAALAVLVARYARRAIAVRWTRPGREGYGAAMIIGLCALHSVVDYPLRRMGVAAVFFIALALLLRIDARDDRAPTTGRGKRGRALG